VVIVLESGVMAFDMDGKQVDIEELMDAVPEIKDRIYTKS
jgi:uncharacterized spore protein YtfJ